MHHMMSCANTDLPDSPDLGGQQGSSARLLHVYANYNLE